MQAFVNGNPFLPMFLCCKLTVKMAVQKQLCLLWEEMTLELKIHVF